MVFVLLNVYTPTIIYLSNKTVEINANRNNIDFHFNKLCHSLNMYVEKLIKLISGYFSKIHMVDVKGLLSGDAVA